MLKVKLINKAFILLTIIFVLVLLIDIYVKLYLPIVPYRYISKPFVLLSLMVLVGYCDYKNPKSKQLLLLALTAFLIGDILIINHLNPVNFALSMLLFIAGKLLYSILFTHKEDFKIKRLIPFFVFCVLVIAFVFNFIYPRLGNYFIPVTLYFIITLIMSLFAYIRHGIVSKKSYTMVMLGISVFLISEIIMVFKTFYDVFPYQDFLIMFFYGIGQYLIITGLLFQFTIKGTDRKYK